MDKFLDTHSLPKLIQENMSNLNRSIAVNETKGETQSLLANKSPEQINSQLNSTKP